MPATRVRRATNGPQARLSAAFPDLVGELRSHLVHQPVEGLRDGLVTVPGGMLVDRRGPRARVPQPGHQFFQTRAGRGSQRAADVPQIVEMQSGIPNLLAGSVPDRPEV